MGYLYLKILRKVYIQMLNEQLELVIKAKLPK